ncbi:hypothetical protein H072_5669 [Dactylellina haptotyla CBS 200.50]|uniref:Uncharacterized protein n=1 Tax=Dactylellina haptotyla (strain CBS 200.50) TaxID=1284197 RepID=S8AC32_DACHA|nr:hypothetical protein H072_5669 [Dactylellina haptotyla CBS 200.50]
MRRIPGAQASHTLSLGKNFSYNSQGKWECKAEALMPTGLETCPQSAKPIVSNNWPVSMESAGSVTLVKTVVLVDCSYRLLGPAVLNQGVDDGADGDICPILCPAANCTSDPG